MASVIPNPSATECDEMHALYRQGGAEQNMAPHVVYRVGECPHDKCNQSLHAIDFRLEAFGRSVHDPLVRAWWNDIGFAGRCPSCGGWIHFTIRGKRAIDENEARSLPQLPANWADEAVIL
ncbi:MAG TPA: hypothetical protein VFW73_00350 [Lacipirellulaceae bacterium]|nr:hypothetical protein [Lacipirellulaceae bacterium]